MRLRLRRFLLSVFALFALIPLVLAGILFRAETARNCGQTAELALAALGRTQTQRLDDFLTGACGRAAQLAEEPAVQRGLLTDEDPLLALQAQEELTRCVKSSQTETPYRQEVCVMDADGVVRAQSGAEAGNAATALYQAGELLVALQKANIFPVEDEAGLRSYSVVCPVVEERKCSGYVLLTLDPAFFEALVKEAAAFSTGSVTVVDAQGFVPCSSWKTEMGRFSEFTNVSTFTRDMRLGQIFSLRVGKEKYVAYYEKLEESELDWGVLCMARTSEFEPGASFGLVAFCVLAAVFLLLLFACGQVLSRYLTKPMDKLAVCIRSIDAGDYSTSVPFLGSTEFGEIGKAFNSMLTRIRKDRRELSLREERNRIINEQSNSIILEYNLETRHITSSPNGRMLAGYPECFAHFPESFAETIARHEDTAAFNALFLEMCRGQKTGALELQLKNYKNEIVWFNVLFTTIADEQTCKPLRVVGKLTDIDEEKRKTESLTFQAERDPLTQLYNKAATHSLIAEALTRRVNGTLDAMFIMDVDNFKRVNDGYGHQKGDAVLVEVADALRGCFRETDIVGRMGGDEFMMLLCGVPDSDTVCACAERILAAVRTVVLDEKTGEVMTASLGAALCPQDGTQYTQLYAHADNALYAAKRGGKNNYALFRDI